MALQKQTVPIVIEGMDAGGTDVKVLSGSFARVENGVYPRRGAVAKRSGQSRVTGAIPGAPSRLIDAGGTPMLWGGAKPSRITTAAAAAMRCGPEQVPYGLDVLRVGDPNTIAVGVLGDVVAQYSAYAPAVSAAIPQPRCRTYHRTTGVELATINTTVSVIRTGSAPIGTFLVVGGVLQLWCIGTTIARDVIAKVTIGADGSVAVPSYVTMTDANRPHISSSLAATMRAVTVVSGGVTYVCCAYLANDNTIKIAVCPSGDTSTATITTVATPSATSNSPVGVFALGTQAVVLWYDDGPTPGEVRAKGIDVATGTATIAEVVVDTVDKVTWSTPRSLSGVACKKAGAEAETVAYIVYDVPRVFPAHPEFKRLRQLREVQWMVSAGVGSIGIKNKLGHVQLAAHPIPLSASQYLLPVYSQASGGDSLTHYDTGIFYLRPAGETVQVWNTGGAGAGHTPSVVVRALQDQARLNTSGGHASMVVSGYWDGATHWLPVRTLFRSDPTPGFSGWSAITGPGETDVYTLAVLGATQRATADAVLYDGSVYLGGALPSRANGVEVFEHGYCQAPDRLDPVAVPFGAGAVPAGTHRYLAVFEHTDGTGRREQSRPGVANPTALTTASTGEVHLTFDSLTLTNRTNTRAVFYRTITGTDAPFYRVGSCTCDIDDGQTTFVDLLSDFDAAKNERLYTTGGVVESSGPPPYEIATIHGSRHVCVSVEDGRLYYSTPQAPGQPLNHSALLKVSLDLGGQTVTAMRSFIDRLIVWTRAGAYVVDGQGYTTTGQGDNYREPYPIVSAVGCRSSRTVVSVPQGIAYASPDSIWVLTPQLRAESVGAPVQHYLDTLTLSDACVLPEKTLAIWTTTDGAALAYDYSAEAWSNWTGHLSTAACVAGGKIWRLSSGNVYYSDDSRFDDDGAFVSLLIETGWLSVEAWQRIYEVLIIGQSRSSIMFHVKHGYDRDPCWTDAFTFSTASLQHFAHADYFGAGLDVGTYTDQSATFRCFPTRQKCGALRLHLHDAQVGPVSTRGFELSALQLLVGVKTGLQRVSPARQIRGT